MKHVPRLVLLTLLTACTSAAGQPDPADQGDGVTLNIDAPPSSDATTSATARELPPAPSKLGTYSLPGKMGPSLGEPCKPAPADVPAVATCGNKGRISLELQGEPLRIPPPCELRQIGNDKFSDIRLACVDGDHFIAVFVCTMCRIEAGSALHVRLSELTEPQQKYLRQMLQLGDRGPTTPDGWRTLVANAPKH